MRVIIAKYHGPTSKLPMRISVRLSAFNQRKYYPFDSDRAWEPQAKEAAEHYLEHVLHRATARVTICQGTFDMDEEVFVIEEK